MEQGFPGGFSAEVGSHVGSAEHHRGEAWSVVGDEFGRDDIQRWAVGQPLETSVEDVGQLGREARRRALPPAADARDVAVQAEASLGHVADDPLQFGLRDGLTHCLPLGVGDQRT